MNPRARMGPRPHLWGSVEMPRWPRPHFFVEKFHTISTLSTPMFFVLKPFSHYVSTTYEIMPKVGTQIVI